MHAPYICTHINQTALERETTRAVRCDTKRHVLQANDGVRRVSELQKEVAHCKQERQSCQHAAHQAANNVADLQVPCCSTHKPSCY
jgi:multidrug resistance efflux pump